MIVRTIHIGVGGRGAWPIEVLHADPRFLPVALVDRNLHFLSQAQAKLGLPASALFSDLEAAIRSIPANAVVICTPTRTHAPLARIAFAAGKHVLVEKGMTMDWEEAKALVREHPYHPGHIEIVDYIHHRYRPEPRTLNYPFAMIWDMSCHHVDSLSCWLGEAKRATAHSYNTSWSQYTDDANIAALIEYRSGAVCHYVLTHTATLSDWRVILQGERGALRLYDVPGVQFYPRPTSQLGASGSAACEMTDCPRSEQGVIDDFHRYIMEGMEPGISGKNNLRTLVVCEMLVRSAQQRRPIEREELD